MRISLILIVVLLGGCTSNSVIETPSIPTKEVKASPQSGLVQVQHNNKELVAMLCSAIKVTQAKQLLQQHQVLLVKQSSPTILSLSWSDSRTDKQVVQVLQQSDSVFCGIESNQTYTSK